MNIYIKNLNLSLPGGEEEAYMDHGIYTPMTKDNCADGVYILTESENLWLPQFWGLSKEKASSVAVIKGETKRLVALKGSDTNLVLLPKGEKIDLIEHFSINESLKVCSGKFDTDVLCKAGSEAALFCRKLGESWYLPALGEMQFFHDSKKEVDAAITIAGGDPFFYGWHWTSTRYSDVSNCIFNWDGGNRYYNLQNDDYRVRPVSAFL